MPTARDACVVLIAVACAALSAHGGGKVRFEPWLRLDAVHPIAASSSSARVAYAAPDAQFAVIDTPFGDARVAYVAAREGGRALEMMALKDVQGARRRRRASARGDPYAWLMAQSPGAAVVDARDDDDDDEYHRAMVRGARARANGHEMDGFAEAPRERRRADVAPEWFNDAKTSADVRGVDANDVGIARIAYGYVGVNRTREVVVVVTRDLRVMCFDARTLRSMWRADVDAGNTPSSRRRARVRVVEVSIAITDASVFEDDVGMVIVGARVERRISAEASSRRTSKNGAEGAGDNDDDGDAVAADADDVSGEFTYYALDGASGERRWTETDDDGSIFHRRARGRLSLPTIDRDEAPDDYTERACREFKSSFVSDGLPHQWRGASDTKMRLAHFRRNNNHEARGAAAKLRRQKKTMSSSTVMKDGVALPNGLARFLGGAVEKLHGAPKTTAPRVHSRVRKQEPPNVVVSHHADGVDVLHLYSGKQICAIDLPNPGLHVDLDGDGVIDHVEAHGWKSRAENTPQCWATVTAGETPAVAKRVLSATICRGGSGMSGHRAAIAAGHDHRVVDVVPPVSLRRLPETANELARPLDAMSRDAIFLNNRGDLTCYDVRDGARRRWQLRTPAGWDNDGVVSPSLTAFSTRVGGYVDLAVAAGARSVFIVDAKGRRAAPTIELTTPPAAPLIVADVNRDGLHDLVLRTQFSTYVWIQKPKHGNLAFMFLLGCLTLVVLATFAYQLKEAHEDASAYGGKPRIVRSTALVGDESDDDQDGAHRSSESD